MNYYYSFTSGHILMTGPATKVFDGEIEEIEG